MFRMSRYFIRACSTAVEEVVEKPLSRRKRIGTKSLCTLSCWRRSYTTYLLVVNFLQKVCKVQVESTPM